MREKIREYVNTHVGKERQGAVFHLLERAIAEDDMRDMPSNWMSQVEGKVPLMMVSPIHYVAALYTETKDNAGGNIAIGANGIRMTIGGAPVVDNDDYVISGVNARVLSQDVVLNFSTRVQLSSAANIGITGGIVTSGGTELFTGNPTDGVFMIKAKNAATPLVGRVVENGNAAGDVNINQANSGTDLTMTDAGDVRVGFACAAGSSAALSWGCFYCAKGSGPDTKAVITPFTSAQLTKLRAMLATTAPTLAAQIGCRVNGTTARTMDIAYACAFMDRV